ncbi:MAG: DUF2147 domain-containing protein [Rhodoblastus sp.]
MGLLAFAGPAMAADIVGTWLRSNGESRVRMAPCGGGVCGTISWLKNPANGVAKVGQQVFFNMKPDGSGGWEGSAFNPEDGKTYTGKASVSGASMTTKGCVLGGLICKSVSWKRVN